MEGGVETALALAQAGWQAGWQAGGRQGVRASGRQDGWASEPVLVLGGCQTDSGTGGSDAGGKLEEPRPV